MKKKEEINLTVKDLEVGDWFRLITTRYFFIKTNNSLESPGVLCVNMVTGSLELLDSDYMVRKCVKIHQPRMSKVTLKKGGKYDRTKRPSKS